MKQTQVYAEIQAKMAPGVIARDGFLGQDRRNLQNVAPVTQRKAKFEPA